MFNWYRELTKDEKQTFWACYGGWAMDAMDAQIFSFLIPTLIAVWGITAASAGTLATASLISSAIGGWIAGILCDRYGRVRVMQFTIVWYAAFTFLSGLTMNYDQLLVVKVLQGFGFGGEWIAGALLIGEIIRPEHRGKAVGSVQSGFTVGWALAAIVSTIFLTILPPELAWRVALAFGALPALLVIYVRRYVKEPKIFSEVQKNAGISGGNSNPLGIFRWPIIKTTILTSLLAAGIQGAGYSIGVWLPTFLKMSRGLSTGAAGTFVLVIAIGGFFGYLIGAYLSDTIGRRQNFLLFSAGSLLTVAFYTYVPMPPLAMLLLGLPLGFFHIGIYSALGAYFSELFPTRIRGSGQSFSYNFGRCTGAVAVSTVGLLAPTLTLANAIGVVTVTGYAIAAVATLLLPETLGIDLHDAGKATSSGSKVVVME